MWCKKFVGRPIRNLSFKGMYIRQKNGFYGFSVERRGEMSFRVSEHNPKAYHSDKIVMKRENYGMCTEQCASDIAKGREIYNRVIINKRKAANKIPPEISSERPLCSKQELKGAIREDTHNTRYSHHDENGRDIPLNKTTTTAKSLQSNHSSEPNRDNSLKDNFSIIRNKVLNSRNTEGILLRQLVLINRIIKTQEVNYSTSNSSSLKLETKQPLEQNTSDYSINANTSENERKVEEIDTNNLKSNHTLRHSKSVLNFPSHSKNVLHNCFDVVSKELNDKSLVVSPQYKKVKTSKKGINLWQCCYNIKWPENLSFSHTATTKKDASSKSAEAALLWLYNNKKIDSRGLPILHDLKKVKSMKQNIPLFQIDENVENKLQAIKNIFEKHLKEIMTNAISKYSSSNNISQLTKEWPLFVNSVKSAYKNINSYIVNNRTKLPISEYRQEIIENLKKNRVIILKGETGCGKSTRVPQYILEEWAAKGDVADPCRIIITQPRRIAAISLADRVASERNESVGRVVGYHVRLDSNFSTKTGRIMYCTAGILLRRLQSDPKLTDCTHVLLDEAHERDVYIDLLMNLLQKALDLNDKLKVIVMSATIDTTLFQNYFNNAPVLKIPGFTYPVKEHFIQKNAAQFTKTLKVCGSENPTVVCEEVVNLIERIHNKKPEGAILCFLPGWDEISKIKEMLNNDSTISVVCLHSRMNISDQKRAFLKPPPGIRKVILSTNIAETSVTVNDVVYVIDTGIHKEQTFDAVKGMYTIGNHWISQSSMAQRKGRAGRVQPGESYHLYPYSMYEQFSKYSVPEILRTSLTKIVLDSKVVSNNMNAVEFLSRLPTPPDLNATRRAVEELKELELLDENENLTPLGRTLSEFQLDPKLSKAMVNSVIFKCVTPIVDIATLFSLDSELFSKGLTSKSDVKNSKEKFSKSSDHLAYMRLFEKWLDHHENGGAEMSNKFSESLGLMGSKFRNISKLREIHYEYLEKGLHQVFPISDNFSDNDSLVLGVLLSGVGSILQHRNWDIVKGRLKKTHCFHTIGTAQKATITSESVNFKKSQFPSDYFLYLNETLSNARRMVLIRETSLISPLAVLLFKNRPLVIEEFSDDDKKDQLQLTLSGTPVSFISNREQALLIKACKDALQAAMKYYVYQMTTGGESNEEVDRLWDNILHYLNDILERENY